MKNNEVFPALKYFTAILEQKTGDAYKVEIFPGGQLGSEVEITRECQAGDTVQMYIASSGAFSSFYKNYQAIVALFLFPDRFTAWGEVATVLATKTAHGQFNAPSIISWAKLWETQKYVTFLNHIYNTNTWVVSKKWFKAQSNENQKHILEAARAAIIYSRGVAAHLSELAVDESKEHGMRFNYISLKNMTKLKKMAQVGYRKWAVDDFGLKASIQIIKTKVHVTALKVEK